MKETGMSFCGVLFLIFFVLKLTKVIAWSWWWVTAPLWMSTAIVFALVILAWLIAIFFK